MLHRMEQDFDLWAQVERGDLSGVNSWLGERIHRFGGRKEPADVIRDACGPFDPAHYVDYLTDKYTRLYAL